MARPTVSPAIVTVENEVGAVTMPGTGRTATVAVSRMTTTAKSPAGDSVRSVGSAGRSTVVVAPVASDTTEMDGRPSWRTRAYAPSGVNETSGTTEVGVGAAPSSLAPPSLPSARPASSLASGRLASGAWASAAASGAWASGAAGGATPVGSG